MDNGHAHPSHLPLPAHQHNLRNQGIATPVSSPSNRQQRLLRNRNAKFLAKKVSISGISTRFAQMISANEEDVPSVRSDHKNQTNLGYHVLRSAVKPARNSTTYGILDQVTNHSSYLARKSRRNGSISIFQDTPERPLLSDSPNESPLLNHDAIADIPSPLTLNKITDTFGGMSLGEVSGNARKHSRTETMHSHQSLRNGHKKRLRSPKTRFNSEEYIKHIEEELQLVKESMYSPTTNIPWREKLKAARVENSRLRKEISDLKLAFETDVQKTVEHMTSTEFDLKRKLRSLEEEVELKTSMIQDLEQQHEGKRLDETAIDKMKATIEKLQIEKTCLEDTNRSLSKRNDVLSQLLASSPVRSQFGIGSSSVVREPGKPRPMSMMTPKLHSSPSPRFSNRPSSMNMSPISTMSGSFGSNALVRSQSISYFDARTNTPEVSSRSVEYEVENQTTMEETCLTSRRSTLNSHGSVSSPAWTIPLPISPKRELPPNNSQPQKRRARKFMTGSTQLKPLLLPTLSAEGSNFTNSSPKVCPVEQNVDNLVDDQVLSHSYQAFSPSSSTSINDIGCSEAVIHSERVESPTLLQDYANIIPRQDIEFTSSVEDTIQSRGLQISLDEDLALGSKEDCESEDIPAQKAYRTSFPQYQPLQESQLLSPSPMPDFETIQRELFQYDPERNNLEQTNVCKGRLPASNCTSWEEEATSFSSNNLSSNAPHIQSNVSILSGRSSGDPMDQRTDLNHHAVIVTPCPPRKKRKATSELDIRSVSPPSSVLHDMQTPSPSKSSRPFLRPSSVIAKTETSIPSQSSPVRQSPLSQPHSPIEILQRRHNIGTQPVVMLSVRTIYGTLSRYTSYMRQIKRDPLRLAKRVIANAWHTNWAVFGKLSWWVLGLFLGPSSYEPPSFSRGWDDYDGETIAQRYCTGNDQQDLESGSPRSSYVQPVQKQDQSNLIIEPNSKRSEKPDILKSSAKFTENKTRYSWGQSLYLWGKFSVALMLAVSGAVIKGPAEMLRDIDDRSHRRQFSSFERMNLDTNTSFPDIPFPQPQAEQTEGTHTGRAAAENEEAFSHSYLRDRTTPLDLKSNAKMSASNIDTAGTDRQTPYFDHCYNEYDNYEIDGNETIKPTKNWHRSLANVFNTSAASGTQEYDPESAGARSSDSQINISPIYPHDEDEPAK